MKRADTLIAMVVACLLVSGVLVSWMDVAGPLPTTPSSQARRTSVAQPNPEPSDRNLGASVVGTMSSR